MNDKKGNDLTKNLPKSMSEILELTIKVAGTMKELSTYTEKIVQLQIDKGEELSKQIENQIEKTAEISEIKYTKFETMMDELLQKGATKFEDYSKNYQKQVDENAKLTEEVEGNKYARLEEIQKNYTDKANNIGLFNFKGYKENVENHINALEKHKQTLLQAKVQTALTYDAMILKCKAEGKEFEEIQKAKITALEQLDKQMQAVDKTAKETNASNLSAWKNRWGTIKTKMDDATKDAKEFINLELQPGIDAAFGSITKVYDAQIETYTKRIAKLEEDHKRKKESLDKELASLNSDVTSEQKKVEVLEKEMQEKKKDAARYEAEMQRIREKYSIKEEGEEEPEVPVDGTSNVSTEGNEVEGIETPKFTDEEIEQAKLRLEQLNELKEAEEASAEEKAETIRDANMSIFESEQKVLDERKRIENEKQELEKNHEQEKEKLEREKQKKIERKEKIEKLKKKADFLVSIASATISISEGITKALAYGPFIGPVLAAVLAASGAVQLGIMTGQLKYLEDGGLLSGKRHREGGMRIEGTNIEVEGGEYVVNRDSTRKNMGLIHYINSQRRALDGDDLHNFFSSPSSLPTFAPSPFAQMMEQGGQVPMMPTEVDISNSDLLNSIQNMKIEPRVAVTDIHSVQGQMAQVDEWVGM